jgi:hypothetical protein
MCSLGTNFTGPPERNHFPSYSKDRNVLIIKRHLFGLFVVCSLLLIGVAGCGDKPVDVGSGDDIGIDESEPEAPPEIEPRPSS